MTKGVSAGVTDLYEAETDPGKDLKSPPKDSLKIPGASPNVGATYSTTQSHEDLEVTTPNLATMVVE